MSYYAELLRGYLESPSAAGGAIRERPPFGLGILCFVLSGLSLFIAQSLSRHFLLLPSGPISLILICGWRIAVGVLLTGLLHLLAELSGGRGSAVGLFVFLGLSDLVWALALPVVLALQLVGWSHSALAVWALLTALGFGCVALRAKGIRSNYGLTPALSWMLVCIPYTASILLAMSLISLAVVGAVASILHTFA